MNQQKVKEYLVDGYGIIIFIVSIILIIASLTLALISVNRIIEGQLLTALTASIVTGLLIAYSIVLMRQVK